MAEEDEHFIQTTMNDWIEKRETCKRGHVFVGYDKSTTSWPTDGSLKRNTMGKADHVGAHFQLPRDTPVSCEWMTKD